MVARHVDDRILVRREHFANLGLPDVPRVGAPEVVHPEKAALQQVGPERAASSLVNSSLPTSCMMMTGHWNSSSLVSWTMRWFGWPAPSKLTRVFVSSDSRIDRSMSASG